jgi:hypothetical protein
MKAILIDSKNKTVSHVDIPSGENHLKEMYKKIGCECFCSAGSFNNGDTIYVDDEGLINETGDFFVLYCLRKDPLAGNALILGCDDEGFSIDCKTDISLIKPIFIDKQMVCVIYSMMNSISTRN